MSEFDSRQERKERQGEPPDLEELASIAVDCGLKVHQRLGSGLLENAYEAVLAHYLAKRNLFVERQKPVSIDIDGIVINEGFRADLLVEGCLLIELKAVERFALVHARQVMTYLNWLDLSVGLLMNFGAPTFKEGLRRIVRNYDDSLPRRNAP